MRIFVTSLALTLLARRLQDVLAHDHGHFHDHHHDHDHNENRNLRAVGGVFSPPPRGCSAMNVLEDLKKKDPKLEERMNRIEEYTKKKVKEYKEEREKKEKGLKHRELFTAVIKIPTVVHVLYRNDDENISDEQVLSQIDVLNDDFRRLNADADGIWPQAADMEIEFCMATTAPDGTTTNGITRKATSKSFFGTNDSIKFDSQGGKDAWDTSKYLNIWVGYIGYGILGYAQFPGGPSATDGVVLTTKTFGNNDAGTGFYLDPPYDKGRTTTHEVGHWLNLRHIWGDGNCNVDDFVGDTPVSDAANGGCIVGHVSCNSVDMVQNYMDYSYDDCMNLFTLGQKDRMRATFDVGGSRHSILSSTACGPTSCQSNDDCGGSICEPQVCVNDFCEDSDTPVCTNQVCIEPACSPDCSSCNNDEASCNADQCTWTPDCPSTCASVDGCSSSTCNTRTKCEAAGCQWRNGGPNPGCSGTPSPCSTGTCSGSPTFCVDECQVTELSEVSCNDGIDNDCDGDIDDADSDCVCSFSKPSGAGCNLGCECASNNCKGYGFCK